MTQATLGKARVARLMVEKMEVKQVDDRGDVSDDESLREFLLQTCGLVRDLH